MGEVWKEVIGYEGLYEVSSCGQIYSLISNRHLRANITKRGYYTVELFKNKKSKRLLIHRLVAEAFIVNEHSFPEVNHKNENKTNNYASNLEWCTPKYNMNYGSAKERRKLNTDYTTKERKEIAIKNGKKACKSIIQKDRFGNVVEIFESGRLASNKTGVLTTKISDVLNGRAPTAGGFVWEYVGRNDLSACQ